MPTQLRQNKKHSDKLGCSFPPYSPTEGASPSPIQDSCFSGGLVTNIHTGWGTAEDGGAGTEGVTSVLEDGETETTAGSCSKAMAPYPMACLPNSSYPRGKGKRDGEVSPWSEALKLYKMVMYTPLPYRYSHLHLGPKPCICQA